MYTLYFGAYLEVCFISFYSFFYEEMILSANVWESNGPISEIILLDTHTQI